MRLTTCLLGLLGLLAWTTIDAADVTVGRWNNMLIVSAPAGHALAELGGRLDQRITLDARDQPITATADFLRKMSGINIVLSAALNAQPPLITLQVREMALGNVFRWLERSANIHIGLVHGAVFFSDQPIVGETRTQLYDVSDLTGEIRNFPGPVMGVSEAGSVGCLATADTNNEPSRYDMDTLISMLNKLITQK